MLYFKLLLLAAIMIFKSHFSAHFLLASCFYFPIFVVVFLYSFFSLFICISLKTVNFYNKHFLCTAAAAADYCR